MWFFEHWRAEKDGNLFKKSLQLKWGCAGITSWKPYPWLSRSSRPRGAYRVHTVNNWTWKCNSSFFWGDIHPILIFCSNTFPWASHFLLLNLSLTPFCIYKGSTPLHDYTVEALKANANEVFEEVSRQPLQCEACLKTVLTFFCFVRWSCRCRSTHNAWTTSAWWTSTSRTSTLASRWSLPWWTPRPRISDLKSSTSSSMWV